MKVLVKEEVGHIRMYAEMDPIMGYIQLTKREAMELAEDLIDLAEARGPRRKEEA
jgi:hypothetical protein